MNEPTASPADCADRVRRILEWAGAEPALQVRFRQQLAKETGWNLATCDRAITEYLRFCAVATRLGGRAVPSRDVDRVWHLHLTWSRDYWLSFCPERLGFSLHHQPSMGRPGEREALRLAYAETLHAYCELFGDPDPVWWPAWRGAAPTAPRLRASARWGWALLLPAGLAGAVALGPLDWKGPDFLQLYLLLMALCLAGSLGWRLWHRGTASTATSESIEPSVWQVAYLSAGPRGVVDAAAADLHEQGMLDWNPDTRQLVRRSGELPADPLQRALLPHLSGPPRRLTLADKSGAIRGIRDQLVRGGWWLAPEHARRIALFSALPWWLLSGFGVLKIAIGLERERPVAFLVVLVILSLVLALIFHFVRPGRSAAGRRLLQTLRGRHAVMLRAPRKGQLGLAVALAGTSVLAGTAFADYHTLRHPPSSGDGGGDSGGSDGDSGGGGSGCGGCGGGD
ncbi:TIGR04222 domain-containing membrane protein [Pseudomarimonas salicorniae]|uniref:TIGR04222 domain-containing membrane protein n=1 Tax=Pseudomarimonas salicorniae TaxID=2933270 RepID=A0ABT0GFG5_9GAMM|nr:TIGR04222 domain-containing membrane protein [Lysobacter sp. CAU 1642]MCK7593102.1 TIGR04222 domain-containing membrane protein [Lysobacter sp. CAU 1642]